MIVEYISEGVNISDISDLSLDETLDCGQCFRWKKNKDGLWCGVVKGIFRMIRQDINGITIIGSNKTEFESIWYDYFDFGRDYDKLKIEFSGCEMLDSACKFAKGIRVLHQDHWEALVSFIISQNNNISRIKGIVERLCNAYGSEISGTDMHCFPTPEVLSKLSVEDFNNIGCGYRSLYIKKIAENVINGDLDLELISNMDTISLRERFLKELGIGPKVADCILLYGYGRTDRCPADVWMKRVLKSLGGKMPDCVFEYEGIAQQFLFHYARSFPEKFIE